MHIEIRNVAPTFEQIRRTPGLASRFTLEVWIEGALAFLTRREPAPSLAYSHCQLGRLSVDDVDRWLATHRAPRMMCGEIFLHELDDEIVRLFAIGEVLARIRSLLPGSIVTCDAGILSRVLLGRHDETTVRDQIAFHHPAATIVNDLGDVALGKLAADLVEREIQAVIAEAEAA